MLGELQARRARQFVIVLLLRARGKLPSQELAATLGVSARTIARDCAELELIGVPVLAERGAAGGLRLGQPTRLDVGRFVALAPVRRRQDRRGGLAPNAQAAAQTTGIERLRLGVRGVIARLDERSRADVEAVLAQVDPGAPSAEEGASGDVLIALRRALWHGRRVRLVYPTDGELHTRDVDPLVLLAWEGQWYLSGYCHWRRDVRTFLVSRIERVQRLDVDAPALQNAHLRDGEQTQ